MAASSEHPLATHAVGEVVGAVLERIGDRPDLVVLFAIGPFAGAFVEVADAVRRLLRPGCLIGATASGLSAGGHGVEERAAVGLLAASWGGRLRHGSRGLRTVRLDAARDGDGWLLTGSDRLAVDDGTLVLLAEPRSFPTDRFLEELHHRRPGLTVAGGLASVPPTIGANHLVVDGDVVDRGAVGVVLPRGVPARAVVSQGGRGIGPSLVVTAAEGGLIDEIAGRPALDRLMESLEEADPATRRAAARGLQLGLVLDETDPDPEAESILLRPVLGAERSRRAVAVATEVEVGTTVRFHVRDADGAEEDLRRALAGTESAGALLFAGTGRGSSLFDTPDRDPSVVDDHVTGGAVAGMFCDGEIGPVAGRPFVHEHAASVVLFDD